MANLLQIKLSGFDYLLITKNFIGTMMDKSKSPFIIILPNIIAAILFFAGAYRFYERHDDIGTVIYLLSGIIFLAVGFINIRKLKK